MKRLFALFAVVSVTACSLWSSEPAVNPDPNHTHADFAVWVGGTQLDFSDGRYMSTVPTAETSWLIPTASAHEGEEGEDTENMLPGRKFLHLHDGNGSVIHRHKPGLTLDDFFHSLDLGMSETCFTLDDFLFAQLDDGWVKESGVTKQLCDSDTFHWTMIINGAVVPMNPEYVFNDLDRILLSYGASDTEALEQYAQVTDDSCLYSLVCPERGTPPAESCIADPTVPCVEP